MIYFDNNATTIMSAETKKAMLFWCNTGNPSSGYASAKDARIMMEKFRVYIGKLCRVETCCADDREQPVVDARGDSGKYKVIFTSGASESNCMMLQGVVAAYTLAKGTVPHIVMSAVEHKSLLLCAESFAERGLATLTLVQPTRSGHIRPEDVATAIRPTTCIVCVMHANNETGAINDIVAIGKIAHAADIPFHCDTVQSFGKVPIAGADSFTISFHKLGGPPGAGVLLVKQSLLIGYNFPPLIFGTQNDNMSGGTENIPGIGASFTALHSLMLDMGRNERCFAIKTLIMKLISARIPTRRYTQYVAATAPELASATAPELASTTAPELEVIYLSGDSQYYLPNTILLSVVKKTKPYICNEKMKKHLEQKNIIVSVGSACNTSSKSASHVLYAMGADKYIRKGALRISVDGSATELQAKKFVDALLSSLQLPSIVFNFIASQ